MAAIWPSRALEVAILALALMAFLSKTAESSTTSEITGKRTLYACEEKQLQIECQLGESIQLIRANYGRFSIQICNEHGQLDWKVNCMSPASFQIIANSCQSKQSCQLLASNAIFGDSCPGTQKYLEVHYQCVTSQQQTATNKTNGAELQPTQSAKYQPATQSQRPNKQNVIQQQPQHDTSTMANERHSLAPMPSYAPTMQAPGSFVTWPNQPQSPNMVLPPWMMEVSLPALSPQQQQQQQGARFGQQNASRPHCPETVWRQIRWPASEAGQLVQMPCPAHAHPSNLAEPYAASFACLASGNWAPRVQASRCQSIWLQNLTQRLKAGDSPLSILGELVERTRPPAMHLLASWPSESGGAQASNSIQPTGLFGDDIAQMSHIARKLIDDMDELMGAIVDEKQRLVFAREIIQLLVELVNNLAHEHQVDAWLDLAQMAGERQRIAGQLVQSLEGATVQLASAQASPAHPSGQQRAAAADESEFVKVTENAYVTIRSLALQQQQQQPAGAPMEPQSLNRTIEVSFPSETSTLGTKWMNAEQKFTLHLQVSLAPDSQVQPDLKYPSDEAQQQQQQQLNSARTLKIVFVMIKGLGAQMEPPSGGSGTSGRSLVNSDLVSLSIVADSRFKSTPVKVDLSAPVELVFRHLDQQATDWPPAAGQVPSGRRIGSPHCVYWDSTISDWLLNGCKLVGTNRTHSVCACNHLTTFALFMKEWDEQSEQSQSQVNALDGISGQNQQHQRPLLPSSSPPLRGEQQEQQQPKVQLDSVENELILPDKLLYLAKMLDGHLFAAKQSGIVGSGTANLRFLIYASCLLSALLLALHLGAASYKQAHDRRLFASIPSQAPPSLLVTNALVQAPNQRPTSSNLECSPMEADLDLEQQRQLAAHQRLTTNGSNSDSSPTYSSNYSAALATNKAKLEAEKMDTSSSAPFPFKLSPRTMETATAAAAAASRRPTRLTVPIHLFGQLLALQLLLVLLVESQNYNQRTRPPASQLFQPDLSLSFAPNPGADQLRPIGAITWILVCLLYYLIAAFNCWLLAQLVELNVAIFEEETRQSGQMAAAASSYSSSSSNGGSSGASDKSIQYGATNSTVLSSSANQVSSSIYGQRQQQQQMVVNANFYGAPSACYGQAGHNYGGQRQHSVGGVPISAGPQSSTSPTSSFSSAGRQSADQQTALGRLEDSARLYGQPPVSLLSRQHQNQHQHQHQRKHRQRQSSPYASTLLERLLDSWGLQGPVLNSLVVHGLPLALVALVAWLSSGKAQLLNSLLYTTTFGAQLASWPLLVDSSYPTFSKLLYYGPIVCLILAALALFQLRRQDGGERRCASAAMRPPANPPLHPLVNPYGSLVGHSGPFGGHSANLLAEPAEQCVLNKQSMRPNQPAVASFWPRTRNSKEAKLVCALLLALLALNSICWISFFLHLRQSLGPGSGQSSNGTLVYVFALTNLTLVLLVSWSQRRTLRRAIQLAGVSRVLACLCWCTGSLGGQKPRLAPHQQRARFYRAQNQLEPMGKSGSPTVGVSNPVKVSPSSQSLFLISPAGGQQQQYAPNFHCAGGPSYSSSSSQAMQAQHLYQQLTGQQHIYDSATAINEQQNGASNLFQVMQQQQRPLQMHHQFGPQHNFTLNRSLSSLHHLHHQQHHQAHNLDQRQLMTLKPQVESERHSHCGQQDQAGQFLVLDANNAIRQQQQQQQSLCHQAKAGRQAQSGEADGPLVAFSSRPTSGSQAQATFGPNQTTSRLVASASQAQQPQLSSGKRGEEARASSAAANCISGGPARSLGGVAASGADANQHQYHSIGAGDAGGACGAKESAAAGRQSQPNYADALRAAMIQQQQQQRENESPVVAAHHFRRAGSKQGHSFGLQRHQPGGLIDRQQGGCFGRDLEQQQRRREEEEEGGPNLGDNIYDVASYALNY